MPLSQLIQKLIHLLEVGAVSRYLRFVMLGLMLVGLMFVYDLRAYRNLASREGMDAAQLARNLAEGKGYTTLFIRPFSLYLVQSHNAAHPPATATATNLDLARFRYSPHPDIANPPVYPVMLAGLMKVLPFHYPVEINRPFWSENGHFWRYQPDFLIALFNQALLVVVAALTFFLTRRLFDAGVAWLSAFLVIGCELLWRFSVSGLSTILLLIFFLGVTWCLVRIEEMARGPQPGSGRLLALALAAGGLMGIGGLTRYAFGWAIIPVALFLFFFSGPRRLAHALAALGAFIIILTPWVVRNYAVSGTPFGTAGYAVVENTVFYPQFQLERSLHPDFTDAYLFRPYFLKLGGSLRDILVNELPKLGGSWASVLFLAGLLLGFRGLAARRIRYFLLMCLGTFTVVQALGRTGISDESPEVNSENLLVLLVPLVFCYGVSFFFTFLEQMKLPAPQLRYVIMAGFGLLACLPMAFTLLAPRASPVVYPPYSPPDIQRIAGWMRENELLMSDVPGAVAWYGHHQCIWLSLNAQEDFLAVNDDLNLKPVLGLYLTTVTMDGKFISDLLRSGEHGWGNFVSRAVMQNQIPPDFPLHNAPAGSAAITSGIFLTDWERWKTPL